MVSIKGELLKKTKPKKHAKVTFCRRKKLFFMK